MSRTMGASAISTTLERAHELGSVVHFENAVTFALNVDITRFGEGKPADSLHATICLSG